MFCMGLSRMGGRFRQGNNQRRKKRMKKRFTAHAKVYFKQGYSGLNLPWDEALETVRRVLQFRKVEDLPITQRAVAYAAIGFYAITQKGDL